MIKNPSCIHDVKSVSEQYYFLKGSSSHDEQHFYVKTDRQKKVAARVPSSMCSLLVGVTETTKGRRKKKKKLASGPQPDNSPDRSQSTIAGARRQEHVCRFCNMQQSSCNYIPPGVSRLQQSGVFLFCQLWQISSKHARLEAKPII